MLSASGSSPSNLIACEIQSEERSHGEDGRSSSAEEIELARNSVDLVDADQVIHESRSFRGRRQVPGLLIDGALVDLTVVG